MYYCVNRFFAVWLNRPLVPSPLNAIRSLKAESILILILLMLCPALSMAATCDYYASPSGGGNGTLSSPFKIANFWSVASPGASLCLLDGTYSDANSMIDPPDNLKGTPSSPIAIRALNDGKALINGQSKQVPIRLYLNDWFVVEGMNACCSLDTVVLLSSANNNIVRRVVAWNAADGNTDIFGVHYASHGDLLEDVAGFGIARKIFQLSQGSDTITIRRSWGDWSGSHWMGPKMTYSVIYNNYSPLLENVIGTWSGSQMKSTYTLGCDPNNAYSECGKTYSSYMVDQPYGVFGTDRLDGSDKDAKARILGSIAYITETDRFPGGQANRFDLDGIHVIDMVSYVDPVVHGNVRPFNLLSPSEANETPSAQVIAAKVTGFGSSGSYIGPAWLTENVVNGANPKSTYDFGENIFNTDRGASICRRYKDGVLTKEPLWPWPMNQRIIDAMYLAGRTPVDVTAKIESIFGIIPDWCKSSEFSPIPPPTTLRTQ
jgi:hypothetical protein